MMELKIWYCQYGDLQLEMMVTQGPGAEDLGYHSSATYMPSCLQATGNSGPRQLPRRLELVYKH